ncbi:hypothetical protein A8V23_17690 [Yersinia pestis]|nr:hypothetical protein A8V23_17690 [Yersinia pestis]
MKVLRAAGRGLLPNKKKPRGEGKGCFVEVAWMMDTPLALLKRVRAPERNDAKGRVIINFGLFR